MGYTKTALINVGWSGALRVFIRGLTFIKLAILARILTPSDFGAVGIASLVLAFLEIITETGINVFLIQEKKKLETYLNTAFMVSIARGIIISLLVLIFSKPISIFFKSPHSLNLIMLISLVPFIRGFINPSVVKFRKNLEFSKEFFLQGGIFLVDTIVAVTVSFLTKSPSGLVYGMISGALVEVLLTQIFVNPKPKISFEIQKIKKVINRGKWITLAGIFQYLFENIDDMTVGRIFSDSFLGIYQIAYKTTSLPITEVSTIVNKVTLPVYVNINNDKTRLKRAYLKSLMVTIITVLPIGLILFFFPQEFVKIVLGEKWLSAVGVIKVMSFFGVIRAITQSSYPVLLALKKQKIVTEITVFSTIFLIIGLVFLVKPLGIVGAGISAIIGAVAGIPVSAYYLYKLLK